MKVNLKINRTLKLRGQNILNQRSSVLIAHEMVFSKANKIIEIADYIVKQIYCILQAIKIHFAAVLDSQEGLLAAATCHTFKL